jgi:hypothetical protein
MPRRHAEDTSIGEDAFLDTTANLVGILIILVVVIGTKTKIDAEEYGRQVASQERAPLLEDPAREARALQVSLVEQEVKQQEYTLETQYRKLERDSLLAQLVVAREEIDNRLQSLDEANRERVEQKQKREELEEQLREVTQQMGAAEETKRPKIVLEHLPTPMARTVFSREMHIQLKQDKVTVIPWDRLVAMLKEQVPLAARRNASRSQLDDQLGPVGGFLMRYRMASIPGGFELERFELEPVDPTIAEPLDEAFAPVGRLRLELASRDPAETVVTVWVYPDSFEQFRQLKTRLFEEGFLCAARPLPEGVRIGASPRGSRSSAQ